MSTQKNILADALDARDREVLEYQINIDNYTRMVEKIAKDYPDNADLQVFSDELEARLVEERRQQLRAIVIRDVIKDQVLEASV